MAREVHALTIVDAPTEHMRGFDIDQERLVMQTRALLNARASFEESFLRGPIGPTEDHEAWKRRMRHAALDYAEFANRLFPALMGSAAMQVITLDEGNETSSEKRFGLITRLHLFSELLSLAEWSETFWDLFDEIAAMDGGDTPLILAPEKRSPGQGRRPYHIARLRLRALCWHEHLKAKGIPASQRQTALSGAYRATWDSIRKWREPCEKLIDDAWIQDRLRMATRDFWGSYENDDWQPALERDGAQYYEIWSSQRGGNSR